MASYNFTSKWLDEDIVLTTKKYDREIILPGYTMASVIGYESIHPPYVHYAGFIGIAPYQTLPLSEQKYSFVKQLYDNNVISH